MSRINFAIDEIVARPEVIFVWMTTGRFDAFVMTCFASDDELSMFLRYVLTQIQRLKETETFLVIDDKKTNVLFYTGSH